MNSRVKCCFHLSQLHIQAQWEKSHEWRRETTTLLGNIEKTENDFAI